MLSIGTRLFVTEVYSHFCDSKLFSSVKIEEIKGLYHVITEKLIENRISFEEYLGKSENIIIFDSQNRR